MKQETWAGLTGTVLHIQEPGFCDICDKRFWVRILPFENREYLVCEKCFTLYGGVEHEAN